MKTITIDINADTLREKGYVNVEQFAEVMISIPTAAEIIGISKDCAYQYVYRGILETDESNQTPLSKALVTTKKDLQEKYKLIKPPREPRNRRAKNKHS